MIAGKRRTFAAGCDAGDYGANQRRRSPRRRCAVKSSRRTVPTLRRGLEVPHIEFQVLWLWRASPRNSERRWCASSPRMRRRAGPAKGAVAALCLRHPRNVRPYCTAWCIHCHPECPALPALHTEALLELLADIDRPNCGLGFDAWSPACAVRPITRSPAWLRTHPHHHERGLHQSPHHRYRRAREL